MLRTRLVRPEGSTTTSSPGAMVPEAIWPAKPRKSWCGRSAICTGKRKSTRLRLAADVDVLQVMQQRGAVVPGHVLALVHHVVAQQRRDRDEGDILHGELAGEGRVLLHDGAEDLLR